TGEEEDDLPVAEWRQDDAVFYGLDIQGDVQLAAFDEGELRLRALFDVVEAELDISGNDNVPRLPPMRYGLGLGANWRGFEARIDYLRVEEVDDPSIGEFATDAYNDLGAQVNYRVPMGESSLLLFLRGDNLTDDEQRLHTSFIKDFAPAPGRSLQLGARLTF
ncbi:MAG: TonB-dependent receptor, partial [Pseudomonadota bacterium]